MSLTRRDLLLGTAGGAATSLWPSLSLAARADGGDGAELVAAWQAGSDYHIGVVALGAGPAWVVQQALAVPTRPHGLLVEPGGSVLAVARRPGDWLLRWRPGASHTTGTNATQWQWIDGDRRFNGHATTSLDGRTLWTSETRLEDAQGVLGVRDVASLEKQAEWPTHGMDPHQLLVLPQAVGPFPAGSVVVANGGIPTLPETGRLKIHLARMDASLVVLHPQTGERLGQWRLDDRFLSIRHLAWNPAAACVGIALQAEHPTAEDKTAAPVLAVWDGQGLRLAHNQPPVAGYGGDIVTLPPIDNDPGGFAVSCPRVNQVAVYDAQGRWQRQQALTGAYALAGTATDWWVGGAPDVLNGRSLAHWQAPANTAPPLQWDNHWVVKEPAQG